MQKVNRTPLNLVLFTVLFAVVMFLGGHKTESSSLSNRIPTDDLYAQFIEKSLGTDWYGIYMQENKVGFLKSTAGREKGLNGIVYKIQQSGTIQIPSQEETGEMKINMDAAFNAQPPYSLIRYSDRMIHKNDLSETKIIKTSNGYEARITQGKGNFLIRSHLPW